MAVEFQGAYKASLQLSFSRELLELDTKSSSQCGNSRKLNTLVVKEIFSAIWFELCFGLVLVAHLKRDLSREKQLIINFKDLRELKGNRRIRVISIPTGRAISSSNQIKGYSFSIWTPFIGLVVVETTEWPRIHFA